MVILCQFFAAKKNKFDQLGVMRPESLFLAKNKKMKKNRNLERNIEAVINRYI